MATPTPAEQQLAFDKARRDYAAKQYDNQEARRVALETKAQFYLTFVTAYLAAIFLSLPFINSVASLLSQGNIEGFWKAPLILSLMVLGGALFVALFYILQAMRLREYRPSHPQPLILSLFDPANGYLHSQDEDGLAQAVANTYAEAVDENTTINDRKAKSVKRAGVSIVVSVAALAILLSISIYLQLYRAAPPPTPPTQIILVTPVPATPTTSR